MSSEQATGGAPRVRRFAAAGSDRADLAVRGITRWVVAGSIGLAGTLVVLAAHETPSHAPASSGTSGTAASGSSSSQSAGTTPSSGGTASGSTSPSSVPAPTSQAPQLTTGLS